MAQCSSCSFAFCIYCRQTYHGVSPCKMRSAEQRAIIEKYNNSEGQDRLFMEQRSVSVSQVMGGDDQSRYRYGKKHLERMAVNLASEEYLKDNAQQCPHCNAPIEKNEGCNKVSQEELVSDTRVEHSHWSRLSRSCAMIG